MRIVTTLIAALLTCAGASHVEAQSQSTAADTMPANVVQRFVDAANRADAAAMGVLLAPDVAFYEFPSGRLMDRGRQTLEARYRAMFEAMDEPFQVLVNVRINDGPFVIDREQFVPGPPTGADHMLWMYEVRGGLIVRAWMIVDRGPGDGPSSNS